MVRSLRDIELLLCLPTLILTLLAFLIIGLNADLPFSASIFIQPAALFTVFFCIHIVMRVCAKNAHPLILPIVYFLSGLGQVFLTEIDRSVAEAQLIWIIIGSVVFCLINIFGSRVSTLFRYKYLAGVTGLVLLIMPAFIGTEHGGAKLWIDIGGASIQTGEIAKIMLVIFLAGYFGDKRELLSSMSTNILFMKIPHLRYLGPLLVMWILSIFVLVLEKDLGTSLLFFTTMIMMAYAATERKFFLISGAGLFSAGLYFSYMFFSHVRVRINVWLDPFADPLGIGYQITQSLFAIADGGFFGLGLGGGLAQRIPAAETDMIFSLVAEELGFIGVTAIFIAYVLLVVSGIKIALILKNDSEKLLAVGIVVMIALQVAMISAGVSKLLPLTGITMNFISYGGSSIISSFIFIAMLSVLSEKAMVDQE